MSKEADPGRGFDWRELPRKLASPKHWPSRWHWLGVLSGPTSYILLASVVAVASAKWSVMNRLQGVDTGIGTWLGLISSDLSLHFALIVIFALGEARSRRLLLATLPLALLVTTLAVINALYLRTSGEQLTWEAFTIGLERSSEVFGILGEEGLFSVGRLFGLLVLLALPAGAFVLIRRQSVADPSLAGSPLAKGRAKAAAVVMVPAMLVSLAVPDSEFIPVRAIQGNATLATYWDWALSSDSVSGPMEAGEFAGYEPVRLVSREATRALAERESKANILLVVLESTRWDHTIGPGSPSATPNIRAIGSRGTNVTRARTLMPHTSKALFTMLCGRLPMMQRPNYEANAELPIQCLPRLLAEAGYDTAFMQSSLGNFEDRPRLVERLGFAHFKAWEDIQGEPAGYLASDDESLGPAFVAWLDERPSGASPFFATLLTSAPHHPYRISSVEKARIAASGAPAGDDSERYARLVEAQDHLVGALTGALQERGLTESTIVVVVGDHGEGFGAKGVRQHDNNFYEEGLHVPFVMAGPGIPKRVVDKNVSLVDLTPTILEALGHSLDPLVASALPGASVYSERNRNDPRYFACYFGGYCYGYVQGNQKVIVAKGASDPWYYDLQADPNELKARSATAEMRAEIDKLFQIVQLHHSEAPLPMHPLKVNFGAWECPEGLRCRHPKSPKTFFFEGKER